MKKILRRVRHWLIRKLGGFVEPPAFLEKRHEFQVVPLKYSAQVHIYDQDDAYDTAKRRIAVSIGMAILKNDLMDIRIVTSEEDHRNYEPMMRAKVYVVRPEDAKKMKIEL